MKTIHNILTKIFLILALGVGWGSSAWAQTSQLPLASGVYELKNISNDGDGVGRGYLVSYTAHSSGLGLAECPWGTYTSYHPDNRNNGSTTCSYFYLHANDNGTYTLVSLSTLGGNSEPRFVRVGANQQTSTLSDTEVELNITERTAVSRDGKYSVLISNAGQSIYLSAACGNNSTTSSGAVGATNNNGDGGVPWLFISIPSSSITPAQRAIIDKYLGNVHVLAASEYTLDPASLSKVESLSSVTINLNVAGMTVKCANEDGGVFTDENRPYLILASAHSNRRAHHKAPAGAIPADNVTKTSDGVYNITFDPAVESDGIYDLVVPQGAFVLNDGASDFPITEFSAKYTVGEVAPGKWYIMKVNNGGYVSSDYVDGSNNMLLNNSTKPTNYAGIWMNVPETTVDAKGQGNVKLVNAKYYNDRTFGMLKGTGDGGSDRAQMYPTTSALPTDVSNVFECKVYTGQDDSYYFTLPGTNRYFNSRNGYLGSWDTSAAFGKTGSRFVIEEVPVLGTNVTITVNAPGGEVIKYNTQCEDPAFLALGNVHDVTMANGSFNFHNMPFVPSLFSLDPADPSKILTATFDKDAQTLTLAVAVDPNYLRFSDAPVNGEWAANTKWFTWRNNRSNQSGHNLHYMSTSANSVNDDYSLAPTQETMPADRGSYWCFVGDNTSGFQIYNAAYGPDFVLGGLGDGTSVKYYMVHKDDAAGYNTNFTSVESTVKDGASHGYAFRLGTSGNNHIHVTNSTIRNWNDGGGITTDTGSSFMVEQAELPALAYDVYKVTGISSATYIGSRTVFGKRGSAPYIILSKGAEVEPTDFDFGAYDVNNFSVTKPANDYIKVISADPALKMKEPYKWYIMKVNNGGYVSTDPDYMDGDNKLKLHNTTKPDNYAGIWMGLPETSVDAEGQGNVMLVNAKYYNSHVLALTGDNGAARVAMYPITDIPAAATTVFDRRTHSDCPNAYFYRVPGTDRYFNKQSNYIAIWNTSSAYGETGSRFNIEEVPNLDEHVNIVFKNAKGELLPSATVLYTSQRVDIPTITESLTHGGTYNFGNVPYLPSLFTSNNMEYDMVSVTFDAGTNTLNFTMVQRFPYQVLFTGVPEVAASATATYRTDAPVGNEGTIYVADASAIAENVIVNGADDKFIWGPVIDKTAKTITFDIREKATEFHTGLYQMMLLDEAKINTVDGYIDMFAGDNLNTSSNYIYIAPSVYGNDGAKFKFTGVPSYASEAATAVYLTDNADGTLNLEATGGAKFENVDYSFDTDSHILTLTAYGPKNYGYSGEQPNFEPKEMPQLTNQNGPTRYYLYAADTTPYDYYFVNLVNGSGTTTVKYNKPSLTGTTSYANNSLLVVKKGTQFALTDFSPSDTRILGVEITNVPNETTPGTLTITLENMVSEWTGIITTSDASLDVTGYQVKFNGATYASGTKLLIPAHLEPREVVSTTCTDKFVWGPLVDEDAKTITFDIRNVSATLTPGKWYQMQLLDKIGSAHTGSAYQASVQYSDFINSLNLRYKGSNIYLIGANKTPTDQTTWTVEMTGVMPDGDDASTYVYVANTGTNSASIMMQNGYYLNNIGKAVASTATNVPLVYNSENKTFKWNTNVIPWGGLVNGYVGVGNTSSAGIGNIELLFHPVGIRAYRIVGPNVTYNGDRTVKGNRNVENGNLLFIDEDEDLEYNIVDGQKVYDVSKFSAKNITLQSVTWTEENGIVTLTFTPDISNMIIHRQHGVFDQLEATPAALRPTSTNYIQAGDGMLDQPYKDTFTGSGYIANDMTMQNTSVFHVYQYVIPGQTTQVVLPFTRNKGDLGSAPNQSSHIANYQRWYNYKTERPLDDDIIKLPSPIDESHKTYLGNTVDYYRFDNGHSNFGLSGGEIVRQQAVLGNTYLNFPDDTDELLVAVDASEFLDQDGKIGNKNLLEPSLNERVVFHLIDANQMTNKLSVKGTTTAEAGKKLWWEDHAFYVPRIKRGTNDYDNNVDLLPLDMAWTYYFVPNSTTGKPMALLAESQDWNEKDTNRESLYNTLKGNVLIEVEGSAAPYLEVGVHQGQYGLGRSPYITTNHFLYYMMKGVENRTSGERSVPDGSQAIIKVYGKNDAGTLYQLARFTLNFVADSEPLAITSVYGQDKDAPISHRSEDYFDNSGFTRVAELTFQNKSVQFDYDAMASGRGEKDPERKATYAFPIDFRRTSYGYSAQNTYGQYKIGTLNYGITYGPAELYRKNIQTPSSTAVKLADDYLFYIDAAETPGQVASVPLEGTLCAGTRLYCYGYIGSTNYYDNQNDPPGEPASVVLNLVGRKTSGDDAGATKIIASYLPGMISDIAYTNDGTPMRSLAYGRTPSIQKAGWRQDGTTLMGPWQQIGFSFTLSEEDSHYDEFELQIINNCHSTAGGDYLLDDFTVYANPPRAKMEFSAPLCYDHIPHLKITAPYDLLAGAQKVGGTGADKDNYRISYCFLDHKKYAAALEAATTDEAKNAAFYNALMGNRTASDTYVDGKVTQYRSFWNLSIASTDAGYEAYPDYTFQSALEATSSDVTPEQAASQFATVQAAVFKQMVGSERQIVFATEIGNSLGWEVGEDYDLVFTGGWVTSDFENASNPYNLAGGPNQCSYYDTFTIRPSIIVITDMEDADYTNPTACEGQSVSMSVSLPGLGPDGKSTFLQFMQYDWWIGYGQTVKGGDKSTITPATVHNFNQEKFGTYTTATAEHDAGDDVYLITALKNFRRLYPTAIDLRVCPPKSGIDANGQDVDFTQDEWDCINHYIQPDDNARIPLILGKRAIDFLVREEDADADHNVYVTIIPIEPLAPYDGTENVIYCPDPQQVAIRIESASPHMFNGFTELHDEYPSQMHAVPVRMGLDQFEGTRLSNTGQMGPHHLRIPLRGIKTVNNASHGATIIKRKHKKVHASDADTYQDLIYLVGSDDPRYSDPNSEDFFIESVDENTGTVTFRTVGLVNTFNARTTGDAHMEIGFANNFQPHEGFTYTLKFMFQESIPDDYTGAIATCPGAFTFDLKIVPKYIQWVADEGNGEWTNDRNWARADRDVLHAANAASDGTTPLAGYTSNAANYGDDQLYTQIGNAHSFVPMYFTNVLLHDGSLLPPALYALTPPAKSGNNYTGFLVGLHETAPDATATRFIKYDMLVTPIANEGFWNLGQATMTPLPLVQRYGATAASKNYGCEAFDSNVCNGLTFEPATAMYDAQYLTYQRAWVEYELKTNRWYTLASPLQDTYAGEWYSPEDGGRQLTPHFYAIKYNEALNDRFNPAYYQRSWDKAGAAWIYRMSGDEGTYIGFQHDKENANNVRVQKPIYLNWSYVYNDVTVPYSNGGFSVNVRYTDEGKYATGDKALVRMPKDDDSYLYYQSEASAAVGNTNGQNPDGSNTDAGVARPNGVASGDYTQITRTATHHRLMSDMLRPTQSDDEPLASPPAPTINQSIVNASASNPYYLIGNPLMAPLDMEKFFQLNPQFVDHAEKVKKDDGSPALGQDGAPMETHDGLKYWIMTDGLQEVSMKVNGNWISTNGSDGVVAPLQGFFVRVASDDEGKATATFPNGMQVKYTAEMQKKNFTADVPAPSLRAPRRSDAQPGIFRIDATNDGQMQSAAIVYFSEQASNRYVASEDAETLLDGNIADKVSTVFTAADEQALSINSMSTSVTTIPVGVIAPKDDTRTTLRFSGISQLEAVMGGAPHLYDAENDTFEVLDEETALTVIGTTAGRYFIVCGTSLPFAEETDAEAEAAYDGKVYNLHGIRVATPQRGTVTIHGSRKEYTK